MFYSVDFLCGNDGLSICWLASTMGTSKTKKLSKKMINNVDIAQQINFLINPKEPLALRLSSHLLLGILRIYRQQYDYYSADVQHAVSKLMVMARKPLANTGNAFDLDLKQLNNVNLDFEDKDLSWDTDSNKYPQSQMTMNVHAMDLDSINLSITDSGGGGSGGMMQGIEHSSNDLGGFDLMEVHNEIPPLEDGINNLNSVPLDSPISLTSTPIKQVVPRKRKHASPNALLRKFFDPVITTESVQEPFKWFAFHNKMYNFKASSILPANLDIEHGRFKVDEFHHFDDAINDFPSLTESQEMARNVSSIYAGSGSVGGVTVAALQSDSSKNQMLSSDLDQPDHPMRDVVNTSVSIKFTELFILI